MRKITKGSCSSSTAIKHVNSSVQHDSAKRHVAGSALYIDDMPEAINMLHVATYLSPHPKAKILNINLEAVRAAEGVVDTVTLSDIPGNPDIAPVFGGDLLLADEITTHAGQAIFAVAANTYEEAQRAIALAEIEFEILPAVLDIETALVKQDLVLPRHDICRGDSRAALNNAEKTLEGTLFMHGQEHFYLEGQIGQAEPNEEGGVTVFSSSQHPSELQKLVAGMLNIPLNHVLVEVRRMGGAFGGKESQAAIPACLSALFAKRNNCPVRYRLPRKDDMIQTGKRHPFLTKYKVAYDSEGKIQGADFQLAGDCGCSADLSQGIVDRAMFHVDNGYYFPDISIAGYPCRTDHVSHTAFRGFGAPQGMLCVESMIEDIARDTNKDPLDIRKANLYKPGSDLTPFGQKIEDHVLPDLIEQLEISSKYRERRAAITDFNSDSDVIKKGLALTPIKFGISFTTTHLNQAGALVHIYTDGSIHLNHSGTEMGQGLFTKVAQVVASVFAVDTSRVMVSATRTDKVPNGSPTAASAGSDMNGMAALDACKKIRKALSVFASEHFKCSEDSITFEDEHIIAGDEKIPFTDFIKLAYLNRIPLSSSGFYKTPKIWYDRASGQGHPFLYFCYGASCSEVTVNSMTGEYLINQVDIVHDVGTSLNPAIDIGQIEGGFIQGQGWLTTEELLWNDKGQLISNSPANYKIPTSADMPAIFNVQLFNRENSEETIYRSKAVGEPPLMLPISVWCALRDAASSHADYLYSPPLQAPATPEQVYWAIEAAKEFKGMNS